MKNNFLRLLMVAFFAAALPGFGQGTAFTYQGQFLINGAPANGSYDLTFAVFASSNATGQAGSTLTNLGVGVTNGLFVTTLDFGPGIFTGASRWLDIGVRSNGSVGAFTGLAPLQAVNPAPYAITANSMNTLLGTVPSGSLSGTYSSAITLNNNGDTFAGNGAGVSNVNAAALGGVTSGNYWQTTGNSAASGSFLGTLNNQAVELHVAAARAYRLEPGSAPNVIGGSAVNYVVPGTTSATIAGGGSTSNWVAGTGGTVGGGANNSVTSTLGVVAGGANNAAQGNASSVAGGSENIAGEAYSRIGGGQGNAVQSGADHAVISGGQGNTVQASGFAAAIGGGNINTNNGNAGTIGGGQDNLVAGGGYQPAIGGGYGNVASNWYATISGGDQNTNLGNAGTIAGGQINFVGNTNQGTVGGGYNNKASGAYATVPGGFQNTASGAYSFAAGIQANAAHQGAFVWADSLGGVFSSTTSNEFIISATNGVGINMNAPNNASLYVEGNRSNGFGNSMSFFENKGTVSNVSPALRVLVDGGTPLDGALSVSANVPPTGTGLLAEFGNQAAFVTVISNDGTIYAPGFVGDGSGVTGISSATDLGSGEIQSTDSGLDGIAVWTNLYMTAHSLYLRGDNGIDHNHGLAYCGGGITNFPNTNVQPNGPVLWGYTGGALGVLNGGAKAALTWNNTGVTVTGTLNATNMSVKGLVPWQAINASTTAVPNTGYVATSGSQVTVTLPTAGNINIGDIVRVSGGGSGGWMVGMAVGQVIFGTFFDAYPFENTWTAAGSTTLANWTGVASSGDGSHLVAVGSENGLYPSIATSVNSGATWTTNNNSPKATYWSCVASSYDGIHLIAAAEGPTGYGSVGGIFTSANAGVTWVSNSAVAPQVWSSVASSYNGSNLFAGVGDGPIYISYNAGASWTSISPSNGGSWALACSANGSNVWAADYNSGYLFHSVNAGGSWSILSAFNDPGAGWLSMACSADGTKVLAAGDYPGDGAAPLWYSGNSGSTWSQMNLGTNSSGFWSSVASSASGQYLEAVSTGNNFNSPIYYSTNFGSTWTASGPSQGWSQVASSADGLKLVAVGGITQIYLSQDQTTSSTIGTPGYLTGGQSTATELEYIGSSAYVELSHSGDVFAH